MVKNIIFCADGTWNGPGQDEDHDRVADATNVFKLFANLDGVDAPETTRLADEQERSLTTPDGTLQQVAKYLHGVGDSDNVLVKMLGGAGGAGLVTRVVRGYTFISRNYAAGDCIFVIGFSRGAYTARALGGLIAARGLLDATRIDLTEKEQAYRLGSAEWFEYRAAYAHTAAVTGAVDAMVDMHNQVWDLAASQVLIEEAGGRYAVVRDFPAPDGGRILSAVFGKPAVVDRLVAMFGETSPLA
jgi:hypothetical protein